MAAPHIPNLLARLASGGRRGDLNAGRGRGRGRGGPPTGAAFNPTPGLAECSSSTPPSHSTPQDRIVQRTDVDASDSRMSAVMLGYLNDEYAPNFNQNPVRRQPIINRGTYVRTKAIDTLVYAFLKENDGKSKQIISLGAGTDTRYWRLKEDERHHDLIYHEIDFHDITANKMQIIARNPTLTPLMVDIPLEPESHGNFYSPTYNVHGLDLRDLPNLPESLPGLKTDCPTLLISECCLCYLSPTDASNVIDYFATAINTIGIIIYEPTNPTTSFGQMMRANLAARGLVMPTLEVCGSLEAQKERLKRAGFRSGQEAADIEWLWSKWIPRAEKERLDRIETLDEVEEWELLAKHYVIAWGYRDSWDTAAFSGWASVCPGPGSGLY